jgi:hypothetical protein
MDTARRILIDVSKAGGVVPDELIVKATIENVDLHPIRVGGFGHIHCGLCNGKPVALKRLFQIEKATLLQVRVNHTGGLTF